MSDLALLKETPSLIEPHATLVLAHGAGAPMDSEFMNSISHQLCLGGCEIVRFEFPYMVERRNKGTRRPPDRELILLDSWRTHLASVRINVPASRKLLIGGKSLGGRMASMIADESQVDGLVCLGYPFHPVKKPEQLRTQHLTELKTPTLIVQGTRDPLGDLKDVPNYVLSSSIIMQWLTYGDHDFKPRVKSGYSHQQHIETAANNIIQFIQHL